MTRNEFLEIAADLLEKTFPKGQCQERGSALVLIVTLLFALQKKGSNQMKVNPWYHCECGRLHVTTFIGEFGSFKCSCGRPITFDKVMDSKVKWDLYPGLLPNTEEK